MTIRKKKISMTPEAKERRFEKLKLKRKRQKANKKLGKENVKEKNNIDPGVTKEVPDTAERLIGKAKKNKEKKRKELIPLDQMEEAVRKKILLKRELNRKRRKQAKKLIKEKRKAEQSLLAEDEGSAREKTLKKRKLEKKKRKLGRESSIDGEAGPSPKIAKVVAVGEKNGAIELGGNPEISKAAASTESARADELSKIEKKRAKMKALKERTKLKKKLAAEEKEKPSSESGSMAAAEKISEVAKEEETKSGVEIRGNVGEKGVDSSHDASGSKERKVIPPPDRKAGEKKKKNPGAEIKEAADADGCEEKRDGTEKKETQSRRKAYKGRKKAERKKNAKKRENIAEAPLNGDVSTGADSSGYFSSPSSSKVSEVFPDNERGEEFSSLVAGIESKLKKIRPAGSSPVPGDEEEKGIEGAEVVVDDELIPSSEQLPLSKPVPHTSKSENLKAKLNSQLDGAKFRFINEKLYTMSSREANEMFQSDKNAFDIYHRGYAQQVAKWPVNPVDVIIEGLKAVESPKTIVDFGCGEAKLARELKNQGVHEVTSFDLVSANELVTACDMRSCPLPDESVDIVVFCLSLMGTNMVDFVREANRVLKKNGVMKIAEVESRCRDLKQFLRDLQKCGFKTMSKNLDHKVFFLVDLKKIATCNVSDSFPLALEPCFYKKR